MLEPYDGKLSRTVLRREGARKSPALSGARHDVAQLNMLFEKYLICSYQSLRGRAAVALMTGCGAPWTTYRIGFKW